MKRTVEELLNHLEKPENEDQIKHLANLKNLEHVENVKQMGGVPGAIAKFALRFAQGHMDAFMALAECKTTADFTAFKQTKYYQKIKNSEAGLDLDNFEELKELSKLKELKKLENLKGMLD